ncbi:AAA family ATPase [Kushneria konosiri]|uniref:Endonuclease GajA/Old nuclease/RecF-like AAA domain-containing protein n=1 Tax=Kushneria konosiri TaxID=698828 RepID=A0A2Z2H535_9GAMM|nr:AAA family ATPase [Kushneria konosiri]ARS52394.1 hypothetical protein B9G99_05445 [Kushneria konosiri]
MSNISLKKIKVENFKKISFVEIETKPITCIVGANGSGKSSVLQAVQVVASLMQGARKRIDKKMVAPTLLNHFQMKMCHIDLQKIFLI